MRAKKRIFVSATSRDLGSYRRLASETLGERGYDVDHSPGLVLARVEMIVNSGGWLQGGSDGRASGKAAGY